MKSVTMDRIWLEAPFAAMRLWPEGQHHGWRVNSAAHAWRERHWLGQDAWSGVAAELFSVLGQDAPASGDLTTAPLHWESTSLSFGWLVWLMPPSVAAPGWSQPEERLALVQEFGAIGLFERNLQTLDARWDKRVFELFDLNPLDGPLDFGAAASCVHPDDRERFSDEYARIVREGGRNGMRFKVLRKDGSVCDVVSMVEVHRDAQGVPMRMVGALIEDTHGEQAVRAQQAINAHLRRALELARVSVWRLDRASRRIHFNDMGYRLIGLAPRAEGMGIDELRAWAHPDDRPGLLQAEAKAYAGHDAVDYEVRYLLPDRPVRHLLTRRAAERDANGRVTGLLGITLDQTATFLDRDRAQALSRRIEVVAEAARLGMWSIDLQSGAVEWNVQMCDIYAVPAQDAPATARDWARDFVHPDDLPALRVLQRRVKQVEGLSTELEFRILRPDGELRWVVSRSRREERAGRPQLVGIHLDVTELVRERERAEQAVHEKEAAQRASQAKSAFLARVSHELRTPLNAVLGFAQLIEHDGAEAPIAQQLERVAQIRIAGQHLLALVDDVLDLAAMEGEVNPVTMEPVEVGAILREVAHWHETQAWLGQVRIHVAPGLGWVHGEPRRVRQIVSNLVSNAIKFNRAGGNVWLSTGGGSATRARERWISVRDDGRGIEAAQHERLFGAFDRLDAERENIPGVGLGLAIVRRLVELMKGRVEIDSRPGGGAEFRVSLVAADPPTAQDATPTSAPAPAPVTLLYIEDNPVNTILVQELIGMRPGLRFMGAEDGESGVAMARSTHPEIVLVDMQLPDFDGFEVLRRLQAEPSLAGQVRIALSANSLDADIAQARARGFDDYWTKPIDFAHFLKSIDALEQRLRADR